MPEPQRPVRPKRELNDVENESDNNEDESKSEPEEDMRCEPCGAGLGEDMEAEEEGIVHKEVRAPGQPTKAEREHHYLTHIPFRSWCQHCVRGRGKSAHHLKQSVITSR